MSSLGKKMQPLDDEIARLDAEITRLQGERAGLVRAKALLSGTAPLPSRKRSANVKPIVLDIMSQVGTAGATSAEVAAMVKERLPEVAKDTVASILSRLKFDGALVYENERYIEKRFSLSARRAEAAGKDLA
jgi:hypothetical protein